MSSLNRFKRLLALAEKNEQNYALALGKARNHSLEQKQKWDVLKDYQVEYCKNFSGKTLNGISSNQLREYDRFLSQLKIIIKQQEQIYNASLYEVKLKCKEWETAYQSSQKMRKLVDNCQMKEQLLEESLEQVASDELASRSKYKI
jgi:flagellar export protein FliJ